MRKAVLYAAAIFAIALLADLVSTLALGELLVYLEANVLFHHVGMAGVILFNILFAGLLLWLYTTTDDPDKRFVLLAALMTFSIMRVVAIINNLQLAAQPPTLEEAQAITFAMKNAAIQSLALRTLLAYAAALTTYFIWRMEHEPKAK